MKIKAKWGFIGNAAKLGADSSKVMAGQVLEADDEYAGVLIGKGLAEAVTGAKPDSNKSAAPAENKAADDEKAELFAKLEAKGAEFDKRWGVQKLRDALAAAEAAK